jgi:hypothetical protein
MAFIDEDQTFNCRIIKSYGIFSAGIKYWNKEVNLVSWNNGPVKLDIRLWQKNHKKCGKGVTLTREETKKLLKLLNEILKAKPEAEKEKRQESTQKKAAATEKTFKKREVPKTLEPFYKELKLKFGAEPDECKTARNILLLKYHPDKNADRVLFATRKTIKIKEAYDKIIGWWKTNSVNV